MASVTPAVAGVQEENLERRSESEQPTTSSAAGKFGGTRVDRRISRSTLDGSRILGWAGQETELSERQRSPLPQFGAPPAESIFHLFSLLRPLIITTY